MLLVESDLIFSIHLNIFSLWKIVFNIIDQLVVNVSSNVPIHFNNFSTSTNLLSRKFNLLSVIF